MKSEVIKVAFVKHTGSDLWVIVECQYVALLSTFRRPSLRILLHTTHHTLKLFNKL